MIIENFKGGSFDPILGQPPEIMWGSAAPDGDAYPWKDMLIGSKYIYKQSSTIAKTYTKQSNNQRDDDWVMGLHVLQQRVTIGATWTDGGGASGTIALTETIPVGAWVQRTLLQNVTGFTGNTSAVITVGDGSDVDRYNTGTPSVFTTANAIDLGAPSGTQIHTAAATVTVTVTGASDFTAIAAGAATIRIYYYL